MAVVTWPLIIFPGFESRAAARLYLVWFLKWGPVGYRVLDKYCEQILGILKAGPLSAGAEGRKKNTRVIVCAEDVQLTEMRFIFLLRPP